MSTKLATALAFSGLKVGLYTSPHVSTFRERISIVGCSSEVDLYSSALRRLQVEQCLGEVLEASDALDASYFEVLTGFAFHVFREEQVDVAVMECGVGGRLDATNVIERPLLSVITSIGMDHQQLLGDTLQAIAKEKAGIIKQDCPVVVGPTVPMEVVLSIAQEKAAVVEQVQQDSVGFEEVNRRIANVCLQQLEKKYGIRGDPKGLMVRPACRLEKIDSDGLRVLMDVAHNSAGVSRLLEEIERVVEENDAVELVCGFSRGKDVAECLKKVENFRKRVKCVVGVSVTSCRHYRSIGSDELERIGESVGCRVEKTCSVGEALGNAKRMGRSLCVVFGSVFLMHEVRVWGNHQCLRVLEVSEDEQEHIQLNE